jgi:DNA-binding NtrC family response regulator
MTDKNKNPGALPLRDRKEEILRLAKQFIKSAEEQIGMERKELSKDAEEYLLTYDWPGNEQELELAIKRAYVLSEESVLQVEDFDLKHRQAKSIGKFVEARLKGFMRNIKRLEKFNLYNMVIPEVERSLIRLLGINRNTLRSKIKKLGIKVKSK